MICAECEEHGVEDGMVLQASGNHAHDYCCGDPYRALLEDYDAARAERDALLEALRRVEMIADAKGSYYDIWGIAHDTRAAIAAVKS